MTKLEAILGEVGSLSAAEQLELVRFLMERLATQPGASEVGVGRGELIAGTESAHDEDWTPFYPCDLGSDGGTRP
jgi:hypothetical protein